MVHGASEDDPSVLVDVAEKTAPTGTDDVWPGTLVVDKSMPDGRPHTHRQNTASGSDPLTANTGLESVVEETGLSTGGVLDPFGPTIQIPTDEAVPVGECVVEPGLHRHNDAICH